MSNSTFEPNFSNLRERSIQLCRFSPNQRTEQAVQTSANRNVSLPGYPISIKPYKLDSTTNLQTPIRARSIHI